MGNTTIMSCSTLRITDHIFAKVKRGTPTKCVASPERSPPRRSRMQNHQPSGTPAWGEDGIPRPRETNACEQTWSQSPSGLLSRACTPPRGIETVEFWSRSQGFVPPLVHARSCVWELYWLRRTSKSLGEAPATPRRTPAVYLGSRDWPRVSATYTKPSRALFPWVSHLLAFLSSLVSPQRSARRWM